MSLFNCCARTWGVGKALGWDGVVFVLSWSDLTAVQTTAYVLDRFKIFDSQQIKFFKILNPWAIESCGPLLFYLKV